MYLIDTSVWIQFFNNPISPQAKFLADLLDDNAGVCINSIVEMEIIQGIRSDRQLKNIRNYLGDFQYFPNISRDYFLKAAEIYRGCRKRGVTVRKSLDCLIAANCLIDKLVIVHSDRDFDNIKKVYKPLQVVSL